jgi:hypothetical protein
VRVTTGQAATALECSIPTVKKLLAAGVIPGHAQHGRQVIPLDTVQALQQLPHADLAALPGPHIAVLRPSAAVQAAEPDRRWSGFGAHLTPQELLPALSGWWRCDPGRVAAGHVMPVTVGGFVVAVLSGLHDAERGAGGRYRFRHARLAGYVTDLTRPVNAAPADGSGDEWQRLVPHLLGTRLHSLSSTPIAYVPTGSTAAAAAVRPKEKGEAR